MSKKITLAISIILILIATAAFGWALLRESHVKKQSISFDRSNLNRDEEVKIEKSRYKTVSVSDGPNSFSFDVPSDWLVETRHAGDKKLNLEEMRDFLATRYIGDIKSDPKLVSDYVDFSWSKLKNMNQAEVEGLYNNSIFSLASVALNDGDYKKITYTDWNADQIDFRIVNSGEVANMISDLDNQEKQRIKSHENNINFQNVWSKETVGGINSRVVTFPVDIDAKGEKHPTKEMTGGKEYFVDISGTDKTLIINKQGKGDDQFENNFRNLIESFQWGIKDSILGQQPISEKESFCGTSLKDDCASDADCVTGGCSGQVCGAKNTKNPPITTCEYRDCYNAANYNLSCGCVSGKCQWK